MIDHFTTHANRIVTKYNSYFEEVDSCGTDAFAQIDYSCHTNYCFPPVATLPQFLDFI